MKKTLYFFFGLLLVCGIYQACTPDVELPGSIYGVVVESSHTEPLAGLGVELYCVYNDHKSLLLKTVTYSDGHFEFVDLTPGEYFIKVVATGYDESTTEYYVLVQSAREARVDMQVKRLDTHLTVITMNPIVDGRTRTITLQLECTNHHSYEYDPTELGFIYATHNNPISSGVTIKLNYGESLVKLTNLESNTYYVVAYAVNAVGITYGEIKSFVLSDEPVVTTLEVSNVTYTSATFQGEISYLGNNDVIDVGFVYSYPSWGGLEEKKSYVNVLTNNSKNFSITVDGLEKNETYYVRAFLTTYSGTFYGENITFRANPIQCPTFEYAGSVYSVSPDQGVHTWNDALDVCNSLNYADYSDWYLPDINELDVMYENKDLIGGFFSAYYWSSTEIDSSSAWRQNFGYGIDPTDSKSWPNRVRCVRKEN